MPTVVDYAGKPPGAAAIRAAGHIGAIRYISPDRTRGGLPGKPISRAEVDDFRAHGLELAFVWQYGKDSGAAPPDVMRGREGGLADARAAQAKLEALGMPDHPVYFAVDFDITIAQWNAAAVLYFRAAGEVLGVDRVGIYGHSRVCHWAGPEDGVIGRVGTKWLAWQTRSWSGGTQGKDYCVAYQRIVDTPTTPGPIINGTTVDVNDVWADDWGQKPRPPRKAPVVNIRPNPAHRGDPLFLPDVLRAFGVTVEEFPGWRDRGHGDFGTIWGVMAHHTAGSNTSVELIAYGHSALRGLLSQIHLAKSGVATITGAGIAYHAGVGSWPGVPTNAGNQVLIGVEAVNAGNGIDPWPEVQLDAYYRTCAAICWFLGHSSLRTIGHKEYGRIQGKPDPHPLDMAQFRARVQYYIDNPPFIPKETDMSDFWEAQVKSLVDPSKSFPRKDYIPLIDYHATLSNLQTKKLLAETALVREDLAALADKNEKLALRIEAAVAALTEKGE